MGRGASLPKIMKKLIGFALLAAFLTTAASGSLVSAQSATTTPPRPTIDVACIQAAIEKRDSALVASVDTYAASVKTALTTRKDALKAAWAKTGKQERRTAIKAAWKAYRNSVKSARRVFRDAKNAAWRQFHTDRRACKIVSSADDGTGQGVDETL